MFRKVLTSHNFKLGIAAAAGTTTTLSYARTEKRVYVSGEALGRGVRLEYWKAKHENVVVLDLESESIQLGMTRIRNYESEGAQFVHSANAVLTSTIDLALTELDNDDEAIVTTPKGHRVKGVVFEDEIKVVGLVVSGNEGVQKQLSQVVQKVLPYDSSLGHVIIDKTKGNQGKILHSHLPSNINESEVLIICPEFSSIDTLTETIRLLQRADVKAENIIVVSLVTCPEAADKFCEDYGDAKLVTASFDSSQDTAGNAIPGMGDFENRYIGVSSKLAFAEDDSNNDEEAPSLMQKVTSWLPFGSK